MKNFYDLNDPHLVTPTGDFTKKPPKGELVASPPKDEKATVCDPRDVLLAEFVHRPELVEIGDWIASASWTRPRLVVGKDANDQGNTLYIADPDDSRTNRHRIRKLSPEEWSSHRNWRRYPNLRKVWEAAHS